MTKRKIGKIGGICGIISMLMIFVIPFFIPEKYDNWQSATIYFIIFLVMVALGNILMEKSLKIGDTQEEREDKLKEILGSGRDI